MPHSHSGEAERAVSPVVVVSDPLSTTSHELPLRADSATTATLRVKEELKRSASSPQVGIGLLTVLLQPVLAFYYGNVQFFPRHVWTFEPVRFFLSEAVVVGRSYLKVGA